MKTGFLEAGRVVNTHGVRGEVKVQPWTDTPEFLLGVKTLYPEGGDPLRVKSARVHKGMVLCTLEGVEDVDAAMALKGKVVRVAREDVRLPPGAFFLADVIGLTVRDEAGNTLGTVKDILTPPAHNVYVVDGPGVEHLIPAVPEFVRRVDVEAGEMVVRLIEGM